jgi:hypothetical protein
MSMSQAGVERLQKIQRAKQRLEENGGQSIKEDMVVEWALLDIAENLSGIHFQLTMAGVPKPSVK